MAPATGFIFHEGNNTRMMINCVIIVLIDIHRLSRMNIFKLEKELRINGQKDFTFWKNQSGMLIVAAFFQSSYQMVIIFAV